MGSNQSAVAVVGVGCELPGASGDLALWDLLVRADDAVGPARPETGMTVAGHVDPDRWSGTVDPEGPAFDDERVDPQQRLLLVVVRQALEQLAGGVAGVAGTNAAVYVGQSSSDHWDAVAGGHELDLRDFAGGHQRSMSAGRVSHRFDLRGLAATVDAGQASSLLAAHLAARAVRHGDSELAVAAGVNLLLGPQPGTLLARAGVLADRCRFADAGADGFVRSDGAVAVVFKSHDRAIADGDRVRAVLAGSAAGNDGKTSALLAPSVDGQIATITAAYSDAAVDPRDVVYVEAHGTGTGIDAAELAAFTHVLGPRPKGAVRCLLGSLKTNIGHTEAASGLAGLVKAVLCLEHRTVPANLHLRRPNSVIDWECAPVTIPVRATRLPRYGPLAVGVNGQGITSTNVHAVVVSAHSDC